MQCLLQAGKAILPFDELLTERRHRESMLRSSAIERLLLFALPIEFRLNLHADAVEVVLALECVGVQFRKLGPHRIAGLGGPINCGLSALLQVRHLAE